MPPRQIENIAQLEDLLSEPTDIAVQALAACPGDVILLGAGGKMGPTLARMAKRASDLAGKPRRVIAVSRFSSPAIAEQLQACGVECIGCDLTDARQLAALPGAPNVIFMTGLKFGASGNPAAMALMNVSLPEQVCRKYAQSRIVAFSSGNVYGYSPVVCGGSIESDPLRPVGDYAKSVVAREEVFTACSRELDTPLVLLRLNYACELRYGVLVDIALAVWRGEPIDLAMGVFNILWQGDANAMTLSALPMASAPPLVLNIAGPETLSVRRVAEQFAELFAVGVQASACQNAGQQAKACTPTVRGTEAPDALLNNAQRALSLFGNPRIGPWQMMEWIADRIRRGGELLAKPTHFEVRDGVF